MSTEAERAEMRQELQRLIDRGNHPFVMLQKAIQEGDEEVARLVVEIGEPRFSARDKLRCHSLLKAAFPERPEDWRARATEAHEERTNTLGQAVGQMLNRRREKQQQLTENTIPSRGPNAIPVSVEQEQAEKAAREAREARVQGGYKQLDGRSKAAQAYNARSKQ
jgi:hypothetical protein